MCGIIRLATRPESARILPRPGKIEPSVPPTKWNISSTPLSGVENFPPFSHSPVPPAAPARQSPAPTDPPDRSAAMGIGRSMSPPTTFPSSVAHRKAQRPAHYPQNHPPRSLRGRGDRTFDESANYFSQLHGAPQSPTPSALSTKSPAPVAPRPGRVEVKELSSFPPEA
jgi:hypothetical protein